MCYLGCLAVLCMAISHLSPPVSASQHHYPPGWWEAPASLDDYPVGQIDDKMMTIINPWDYLQRMGIFKLMVQNTHGYFNSWGYNNTGNLLWGLPLQFGWQMSSGRLRDMADSQKCSAEPRCVSPNSWWADMNYYLSVLPFLGALNAGVFAPLRHPVYIAKPTNVSDKVKQKFCTSIQECSLDHPEVIRDWTEFFERVKVASTQQSSSFDPEKDATVALMWKAHTTSILRAQPLFTEEVSLLSLPERKFGVGWALLVEFIAATHFRTDLNNTGEQQMALPPRILKSDDKAPFIPDLSPAQNRALLAINFFHSTNVDTKGLLLKVWRRAMCSPKGRAVGRDLLVNIMVDPWIIPRKLLKLLWGMFIYPC
ncbi:hypothetical protein ACROYT_G044734 [Oculina patagonica]